jgi:hypothetical protein
MSQLSSCKACIKPCESHHFSHLSVFNRSAALILTSLCRIGEEYLCILGAKRFISRILQNARRDIKLSLT